MGEPDRGPFLPAGQWPEDAAGTAGLTAVIESVIRERRGLIQPQLQSAVDTDNPQDIVAHPLVLDNQMVGVVAVEISSRAEPQRRAVLQLLQWGSNWLELLLRQRSAMPSVNLATVVELIATSLEHEHFQGAATAVVTEIATRLGCERVSLGFVQDDHVQVCALSHSAQFTGNSNLMRMIGSAMDEAIDQDAVLVFPATTELPPRVTRAHEELARQQGGCTLCTIPLGHDGRVFAAMTFERPAPLIFSAETIELCRHIALLVGPVLELQMLRDQSLAAKLRATLRTQWHKFSGVGNARHKTVAGLLIFALLFLSLATGNYRVAAKATLEGSIQRVLVAPQNGFIASAEARAGDIVRAGAVLATFDDQDMKLEQVSLSSRREQYLREYQGALADHDRSQFSILSAQIEQVDAQLDLLNEQLTRTRITAPFGGVVVSGDLSQSLGAPVERGQVLFEIAPLNRYRVVLRVDEREIAAIRAGQQGHLALSGLPGEVIPMMVKKVTPVAMAAEGINYFRVEAELKQQLQLLRPGMEGVGKIDAGRRKLVWIWTHKLIDWVRLSAWSWWS
ncbi:MAG: HlyD family efflux transporter periplasmic adaptor subunit [Gammaproteobacteria bacterium]